MKKRSTIYFLINKLYFYVKNPNLMNKCHKNQIMVRGLILETNVEYFIFQILNYHVKQEV
jgi:hypothetical protein